MAFKFPFSNYQELNLDWVLKKLKELVEDAEEAEGTITTYNARLTAAESDIDNLEIGLTSTTQTANAAQTNATLAISTANSASNTAQTARSDAAAAILAAGTAQTDAQTAIQTANTANSISNNLAARVTDNENDITALQNEDVSLDSRLDIIEAALPNKQDVLTFDNTPTLNSTNPVTSGGIYSAISNNTNVSLMSLFLAGNAAPEITNTIYLGRDITVKGNRITMTRNSGSNTNMAFNLTGSVITPRTASSTSIIPISTDLIPITNFSYFRYLSYYKTTYNNGFRLYIVTCAEDCSNPILHYSTYNGRSMSLPLTGDINNDGNDYAAIFLYSSNTTGGVGELAYQLA